MKLGGEGGWGGQRFRSRAVHAVHNLRNSLFLLLVAALACAETQDQAQKDEPDTVPGPPVWSDQSSLQQVIAKPLMSKVQLTCKATGNPAPDIRWMKDGVRIEENPTQRPDYFNYYKVKSKQQKLVISQLLKAHEGKYTCIVANKWGVLKHSTVVEGLEHSIYEPKVIEKPDNQTV